jgi:hypothetical protein
VGSFVPDVSWRSVRNQYPIPETPETLKTLTFAGDLLSELLVDEVRTRRLWDR